MPRIRPPGRLAGSAARARASGGQRDREEQPAPGDSPLLLHGLVRDERPRLDAAEDERRDARCRRSGRSSRSRPPRRGCGSRRTPCTIVLRLRGRRSLVVQHGHHGGHRLVAEDRLRRRRVTVGGLERRHELLALRGQIARGEAPARRRRGSAARPPTATRRTRRRTSAEGANSFTVGLACATWLKKRRGARRRRSPRRTPPGHPARTTPRVIAGARVGLDRVRERVAVRASVGDHVQLLDARAPASRRPAPSPRARRSGRRARTSARCVLSDS